MTSNSKTSKKLRSGIAVVFLLAFCLCITTFALVYTAVAVEDNLFHTGTVSVNLNDGKPVITEKEFLFEPGMTVKKDFFIENESTWDVYYRIYLENIEGNLADTLTITVMDGQKVICSGTAAKLGTTEAADDILKLKERRKLTAYFHYPENAGNSTQNSVLSFDMCADAVQTKNNPDKLFE